MRVALIEAGEPPAALVPEFGGYGAMIRRFLGEDYEYGNFRAFAGELPAPGAFDAMVVSGSACGANDDLAWIGALSGTLRAAAAARVRLVGICFGHQLMARCFGGVVARAPQGWGVGLHRYEVTAPACWMAGEDAVALPASHQDQVVAQPPRTIVHAASAFTPFAVLGYADVPALSCQFHPEFTPRFAKALLEARRSPAVDDRQRAAAIASLDGAHDGARIAGWFRRFLAG